MSHIERPIIISGSTNLPVAEQIAKILQCDLLERTIEKFPNGEIGVLINETVRGRTIFLIQTCITNEVNDGIIETGLITDALHRASCGPIYLVQLLFPYQRQDRRETNKNGRPRRRPISGKLVADFYEKVCNLTGVITVHLHSDQIEGFFTNKCIVENISSAKLFIEYLKEQKIVTGEDSFEEGPVLVAPDVGGVKLVADLADSLKIDYAILDKRRSGPGQSKVCKIVGNVKGRTIIIWDDLIDSGGTVVTGIDKLIEEGVADGYLMVTHGVFSGNAIEKLAKSKFKKIIITDTVQNQDVAKYPDKFVVLPMAPLIAKVIANIYNNESLQEAVRHNILQNL